jgi:hypothetical protein
LPGVLLLLCINAKSDAAPITIATRFIASITTKQTHKTIRMVVVDDFLRIISFLDSVMGTQIHHDQPKKHRCRLPAS